MASENLFWQFAFSKKTVNKAIKVAIVVGIILNLINQGEKMLTLDLSHINWFKFILTFFVPYSVSTYSAAQAQITFTVGDSVAQNSKMRCQKCGTEHDFSQGELISECDKCGSKYWKLVSFK
jgi:hypothetical protein